MRLSDAKPSSMAIPFSRRAMLAMLLAFALVWFCNLDVRRLVHPDEGRYAEIPREMVVTGDWVTPHLDGLKYFEKPALQYWLTAGAYEAFGVHQWTARLWPALAGFLGVLFIGYVGARLGGPTLGVYCAAALGGCAWYALNAHLLTLDAGLTFWMAAGLGSFLLAQRDGLARSAGRRWMCAAWVALGFAVLSKGLIGILLPGATLVLYSLLNRDWALWRRLHLVSGTLLLAAVTAPWFVVVSLRNREFFDFFFIHEHFTRFLTHEHRREGAWWYFIPFFILGILPWLGVFAISARRMWIDARPNRNGFNWQRFSLVWAAFIFLFFSVSGSKLPSYILPMFPALALVIGWQLTTLPDSALIRATVPLVVAGFAITMASLFAYQPIAERLADARQPLAPLLAYAPWLQAMFALMTLGGVIAWVAFRRQRRDVAIVVVAFSALIGTQLGLTGYDALAEERSSEPLLSRIFAQQAALRADVPFYSVRMYDQTLPFYLGRTVTLVDYSDELALGIASEPAMAIGPVVEWQRRWEAADQAYAIMQPDDYARFEHDGVPMRELGRDARRVIVSRR
jgi:4-amino-4-deoxy-L-arabinose transferase-like glycosyltransferase